MFFEAGNFYPDFILWLLADGEHHIGLVDPKGIRNLGWSDLKTQFHQFIREIKAFVGPSVHLHSFIISNIFSMAMELHWGVSKDAMVNKHFLFR